MAGLELRRAAHVQQHKVLRAGAERMVYVSAIGFELQDRLEMPGGGSGRGGGDGTDVGHGRCERVALAKDLLETAALPVGQVAERAGFGSEESLRRHFRRLLGTSPGAYRRAFAAAPQFPRSAPANPDFV